MIPNRLYLEEQDPKGEPVVLTPREFSLLGDNYSKNIEVFPTINQNEFTIATKNKPYVGYIVLPEDNIIKINPKIENANILLMLTYAFSELEFSKEEISFPKNEDFHEILIKILIKRLENLLEHGVLKSYAEIEENLPYVKGKIILAHQLRHNMILKHKTYCRYADLTQDILENQIIKYTLFYVIKYHIVREELKKSLIKLYHAFQFVSLRVISLTSFANLQFNRLTQRYKPILRLCEILIKNGSVEVNALGNFESFAFLLNMNTLFEEFVREYLHQNLKTKGLNVDKGHDHLDLDNEIDLEPDIDIKRNGRTIIIIDTKYKILDDKEATRADVSQVLDYCLVFKIRTGILLYPKLKEEIAHSYQIKNTDIQIKVETIDISCKGRIKFLQNLDLFKNSLFMTLKNQEQQIRKSETMT